MTDDPKAPAGWYPQPDGTQRFWDGDEWAPLDSPAPAAPVDKRRGYVVLAVIAVLLVAWWAWTSTRPKPTFQGSAAAATSTVTYKVHGTADDVSITIQTPTGSEQADVSVPLRNKPEGDGIQYKFPAGAFIYISAQNQGEVGTVECIIEVDGVEVSRNESSGAYQIAQCDGSA